MECCLRWQQDTWGYVAFVPMVVHSCGGTNNLREEQCGRSAAPQCPNRPLHHARAHSTERGRTCELHPADPGEFAVVDMAQAYVNEG